MLRALTLSLTLLLLWAIVAELNHALAPWRVYVFAGSLFVMFAALTQPLRSGLLATCIGGFICDANAPVTFGVHLLLFAAAHATLHHLRDRVPRDDTVAAIVVALLTNLVLFLVFSFTQIHDSPAPSAIGARLLVDLIVSQVFVALVTPWFLALQAHALEFTRRATAAFHERRS